MNFFKVKPTLNKLNDDSDFDVRYFASEAATGTFCRTHKEDWSVNSYLIFNHIAALAC